LYEMAEKLSTAVRIAAVKYLTKELAQTVNGSAILSLPGCLRRRRQQHGQMGRMRRRLGISS
jgi:hypothetical protein